ncbi:MAG: 30S ribosomal protein S3 [Candidatus Gracilibacteria bacterium]|nr:30S ribosomal protein S3 [Candidatus Gracilibacteria bacterium]
MGHKVSPQAFRIPYLKNWSATWFADKKDYVSNLRVDNTVRAYLKTALAGVPVGDVIIARNQNEVLVTVYTSKAALVLGKENESQSKLESDLSKKTKSTIKLIVKEVKKPDVNAKIVGFTIANQIEKRMPYKRAIKQAISKAMEKGAKGIKVKVGGRLNGAEIARKETFKEGNIPTQTIRADIDYTTVRAETVYGTIGLKVWIYKGNVFKK